MEASSVLTDQAPEAAPTQVQRSPLQTAPTPVADPPAPVEPQPERVQHVSVAGQVLFITGSSCEVSDLEATEEAVLAGNDDWIVLTQPSGRTTKRRTDTIIGFE